MAWKIYKKGQGKYTRLGTVIGVAALTLWGCYSLYLWLDGQKMGFMTPETKDWVEVFVALGIFALLSYVVFRVVNAPRYADFMIATEGEMKKVSWSTRKEIWTATWVVIITMLIMGALLAGVDTLFRWVFLQIGILKI